MFDDSQLKKGEKRVTTTKIANGYTYTLMHCTLVVDLHIPKCFSDQQGYEIIFEAVQYQEVINSLGRVIQ